MKPKKPHFIIGLLLLLIFCFPAMADIYSWTDEAGVVHYSNREPVQPYTDMRVVTSIPYDQAADDARWEMDQKEWDSLRIEIDAEDRQRETENRKELKEKEENKLPSREEQIEAEKIRLEKKIAELEEMPLSAFGSQKNKRRRLGIYHYKLADLEEDPDAYFGWSKK